MHFARVKTLSALDRRDDDLGGAEQHGIDGVEVAFEPLEDLSKRRAEIARHATGKRLSESLRIVSGPGDIELRASAVDDRIVGAAHGADKIGMRRTERRGAHAVDDAPERKFQLMRLVQRHFQHARDHLGRPSQALSGRINHCQSRRRDAAIARHFVQNFGRRRTPALDDKRGDIGFASLRGGTNVGEHRVMFAGPSEILELTHRAEDRLIFARGALHAALWARGQKPGLYSMADVLGLGDK